MQKKKNKIKMPYVEALAIETLDDDVDIQIVRGGPSTKRKQTSHTKATTEATKSKKTTSKEEHEEDEEFGILKYWRDSDVKTLIALRGEIGLNFVKNAMKQGNFLQIVYDLMLHVCKSPQNKTLINERKKNPNSNWAIEPFKGLGFYCCPFATSSPNCKYVVCLQHRYVVVFLQWIEPNSLGKKRLD